MGKLVIKGDFDFENYISSKIIDYEVCKIPLFHGTTRYALEVSEEVRNNFYKACRNVLNFAKDLIAKEKIEFNIVAYMLSKSKKYEYGDIYLTTSYSNAIIFSYQRGGELGQNANVVSENIINSGIIVSDEIKNNIDFIRSEYEKYINSEKVILVFDDVKFADLCSETGFPFIDEKFCEDIKEDVEDVYKSYDKQNLSINMNFRLKNVEKYPAFIIPQKDYRKGFSAFTEITDVDKYIRSRNSFTKTKWDF